MDLISRQAVIDVIDKIFPADPMQNEYTQGITCGAALAEEYVIQLSSTERTGEWIDTGSGQECSECHEIQYGYDNYRNFCPNCGAKMERSKDERG